MLETNGIWWLLALVLLALISFVFWWLMREKELPSRDGGYTIKIDKNLQVPPENDIGEVRVRKLDEQDYSLNEDMSYETLAERKKNLPSMICLYIKAKPHECFYGYDLMQAILNEGLVHGAMDFFHYASGRQTLFSLTSIESPGGFDLDTIGGFKTSGLCLFMQPQRFTHPDEIFDKMVDVAQRITEALQGVLEDEHHHLLTPERLNDWHSKLA